MKSESEENLVGRLKPRSPLGEWGNLFLFAPLILALLIGLIMPMVERSREMKARSVCAQHLKKYVSPAIDRKGQIIKSGEPTELEPCPNAAKLNYVIVDLPYRNNTLDPGTPIIYEPLENHGDGGNIGFLDGHTKWHTRVEYNRVLAPYLHPQSQPSTANSPE